MSVVSFDSRGSQPYGAVVCKASGVQKFWIVTISELFACPCLRLEL